MTSKPLNPDALRLEEAFFAEENCKLLEQLRSEAREQERRAALAAALRIDDPVVLDALVELDIDAHTALAFSLVPMVEVAWADGEIQPSERKALLEAAATQGVVAGSTTAQLLDNWLHRRPRPELHRTWKLYMQALVTNLDGTQRAHLRDSVLGQARAVAAAAGGFLGLGSKVSKPEQAVLDEVASLFA